MSHWDVTPSRPRLHHPVAMSTAAPMTRPPGGPGRDARLHPDTDLATMKPRRCNVRISDGP
ncbi:hypothetical protein E2562_024694 [Oryza meyeriana var. granulata]|uniref:Uncharacterized protein n=1 Tax=Oryza meyeriana var. granulata TaxID=110450 RepID=A0A6G1C8W8_9ORYZ|nr:hypothetical protein E2562_024694 [Oryza meyeriana var. granulata]